MLRYEPIFMGVDGGGSRCRTRLRDQTGMLLATVEGGPANVYLDFDRAVATVRGCVAQTLAQAGLADSARSRVHLGLGLAGAASPSVARQVSSAFADCAQVRVVNDAETACIGAHAGQDGGLIVAGTGSVGVVRIGGRVRIIGGRGFVLGDEGSGARIGLEAWRRALMAHDGLGTQSDLTRALMGEFSHDPAEVIRWGLTAGSSHYAAYAPAVFAAAARADPVANQILAQAAASLGTLAEALRRLGAERLALVGGLAQAMKPYLDPLIAEWLNEPRFDALEGAILLIGGPLPGPDGPLPSPVRGGP